MIFFTGTIMKPFSTACLLAMLLISHSHSFEYEDCGKLICNDYLHLSH